MAIDRVRGAALRGAALRRVALALLFLVAASGMAAAQLVAARTETLAPAVFAARRAALLERLGADAVVVLFAAPVHARNHDVDHPYRQSSDFWYLTGFAEPGSALLLRTRDGRPHATLFVPPRDPGSELWDGARLGVDGAAPLADEVRSNGALAAELKERLADAEQILVQDAGDGERRKLLDAALPAGIALEAGELREALGRQRLLKSSEELALLQRAVDISAAAHVAAMRYAAPGRFEYELQGVIEATFLLLGARRVGYPCIVGSGANSCVLHYDSNRARIPERATIVIDVGAEYGMYTADVTRTLPSDGRFTPEQRIVYQAVLDAQVAAIAAVKPGATLRGIEQAARRTLGDALQAGGVVKERSQAMALLPHGTCHWLGLDVHDEAPYRAADGRGEVRLEPGMVLTVEPGCYIAPGCAFVEPRFHAIGVRIEDDVAVTAEGCVVLSARLPKTIAEIEQLMDEESQFPRLLDATEWER